MSQISTRLHGLSSLKEFSSDGAKNSRRSRDLLFLKLLGQVKVPLANLKSYGKNGFSDIKHRENVTMHYLMI
jgi:hypothetical protein